MRLAIHFLAVPAAVALAAPVAAATAQSSLVTLKAKQEQLLKIASANPPVDAIVSMMSADTLLYARGGPFVGPAAALAGLSANPGNKGAGTTWRAVKYGLSSDGLHGFSFGYFDIQGGDDPKLAHRRFLAYWVRDKGEWKIAAMKQGLLAPQIKELSNLAPSVPARSKKGERPDPAEAQQSLKAAEKSFSDAAQQIGLPEAFTKFGRPDAINGGTLGAANIGKAISQQGSGPTPIYWSADQVLVAPSGDLGITFGVIRPHAAPPPGQPAEAPFFTIWMRDSLNEPWRYIAE